MKPKIKVYSNPDELADSLAAEFHDFVNSSGRLVYVAFSGGTTPILFFEHLARPKHQTKIKWQNVHMFWGDERCIPPTHPDSNYGMTQRTLLNHITIPERNIHRIFGEENPVAGVAQYIKEINQVVPTGNTKLAQFDWIFLGLGEDGHTASIFPESNIITETKHICGVATHPKTKQKRVTLTLPVINNAIRVSFVVTGKRKAPIIASILNESEQAKLYPAAFVKPRRGILEWYLDELSSSLVDKVYSFDNTQLNNYQVKHKSEGGNE